MYYGTIIKNVTDLRAEPKFHSERKSQVLFNEPLKILSGRGGYLHVEQADGYAGWVAESAVEIISYRRYKSAIQESGFRVVNLTAPLVGWSETEAMPRFLFYGTNLIKKGEKKGGLEMESLTGAKLIVPAKSIGYTEYIGKDDLGGAVVKEAKQFLGTPYLWGGITPFGLDCSGLVRVIYSRFGIMLPRDSKDQRHIGRKIALDQVKAGDLLFFTGHVAISLERKLLLHSSLKAGGVAIESLEAEHPRYRADLIETFVEARRVLR